VKQKAENMAQEVQKITVIKNEKNDEIRKLDDQMKRLESEMTKKDEILEQCKEYQDFLNQMAEHANL